MTALLFKAPVVDARDSDVLSQLVSPYIGYNIVEPGGKDFRAVVNIHRLQKCALLYGKFDHSLKLEVPDSATFLHGFPMQGSAQHRNNGASISDTPAKGAVGGPGPLSLSYGANFETLALIIDPAALLGVLSGLVGAHVTRRLTLDKSNYGGGPETRALREIVRLMVDELDQHGAEPSPLLMAEFEQAALVAFLAGTIHNHSKFLDVKPRSCAPWQVRRVEEYIRANWSQPLTIEAFASLTGASARSIFLSFKQYRGYSPMEFVRRVRLEHARAMLSAADPSVTILRIALDCGFGNLGHFARNYRGQFGERPSRTKKRAMSEKN